MKKLILSIQGGGIRGILPCLALAELERQTGKLTRDIFDFVGGTSTGALLAAAIAAGVPALKSLDVYLKSGPAIFSPKNDVQRTFNLVTRGRQFDNKILHQVLLNTLPQAKMTINDSPIGILITAGNMNGVPWYFVRDSATNAKSTGTAPLVDAAVASACATTYHDAWPVPGFGYFFDGGCVSLADPVYQTCIEAFKGFKCYGDIDPVDARVISLGTGFCMPATMPAPPHDLLANVKWVTGSLVGSSKTFAQECVERHFPGVLSAFNLAIPTDIDEADVNSIPLLMAIGARGAAAMDWKQILA